METIPETQGDSSGLNPSSAKSDDSSPRHGNGRNSPPPNCAICLGTCRNKSFTDSCLHQFCFKCLLKWSKVKAECPLCKQNFRSIIHNVRSNHQYEEYLVGQQETERVEIDSFTSTRRFRYRTTLTLPRSETYAIQELLLHYPLVTDVLPPPRRHRSPASFRRTVYRHNLWARPLPDFTGRFRDCTPEFYRYNDTQIHRLVPWLNRELYYLLHENVGHISYVMTRIIELLPQYHITSPEFKEAMYRYFGVRTDHFLHELYCFASTPYDMTGYDRNVQYTTDSRISTMVNEVISSSDSEASVDSDIVMLSSTGPADAPPGPSGLHAPQPASNVIPIETISQSDTDDDSSEVMVVGYIKPPQERTPEVVDLLGSDSDVIVQDAGRPEPAQNEDVAENLQNIPIVKLTLKRQISHESRDSESDDSTYRPPTRHRRRPRSGDSATTADTRRATPSISPATLFATSSTTPSSTTSATSSTTSSSTTSATSSSTSSTTSPLTSRTTRSTSSSTLSSPSLSTTHSSSSSSTSDTDSSSTDDKRKRLTRKKTKSKRSKENRNLKSDRKKSNVSIKRSRRHDHREPIVSQAESERRAKRKSHSGKGVKSSKRKEESSIASTSSIREPLSERAGPSTSSSSRERRKSTRDRKGTRSNRENKRLKSVVNVTSSYRGTYEPPTSSNNSNSSKTSQSAGDERRRKKPDATIQSSSSNLTPAYSDPEDDLPLNLTVKKQNSLT